MAEDIYEERYLSQDGCARDNLVPTPKNSKLLWQFEPVKREHQEVLTTYVQPVIRIHQLSITTFRVAIGVVARVLLPTVVGVYWAVVRNRSLLLDYLRRYLLPPALIAHLANTISRSLSSVQVLRGNSWKTVTEIVVEAPKRLTRTATRQKSIIQQEEERCQSIVREIPEKCVTCTVLSEPEDGEITADVIFVHGLHGSLYNTWRQGDWDPVKKRVVPPVNQMLRRCISLPATNSTNGMRACNIHFSERNSISGDDSSFQYNEIDLGMKTNSSVIYNNNNNTCSDNINNVCEFCEISNTGNLVYCSGNNDVGSMVYNDGSNNNMYESGGKKYANYSKCWPRDWLPQDCPGIRVIALNYTTDPYLWRPVWIKKRNRSSMAERAREMLEHLQRIGVGQNPIVWVAHSKGGLFVKQMIVDAWESQFKPDPIENNNSNAASSNLSTICSMTRGIMFYSVPHRGSSLADMNLPLLRQSVELTEIQKDCPSILDLHNKFIAICKSGRFEPEIFSFIETSLTFMSVLYLRIVATESADPGVGETCGVPLDHRDICKPSSRECLLYQELACLINRVVERSSYLNTSDIKNVCPKFY